MTRNDATSAYRESAVRTTANQVELVIMMYDMVIEDVRQAIDAIASGEVERRTRSLKHAMLVLEQLQGTLNMETGGEAARNLDTFYSIVRAKLLEAHIKCSPELMRSQAALFADLRAAWKQVQQRASVGVESADTAISEIEMTSKIPASLATTAPETTATRQWTA